MKQAAKFTFTHSKSRTQNIIYPPEKTIFGTSSILARGKSRVLPTSPLFTLCQMVRAFWRDHGSFGAFSKCALSYNICALLYSNRGYTQYQRQVNIFLSLLFPRTTISVSSNGLQRCARTPHTTAITSCSSILYLLNNKVLPCFISANTVSVLRT